jgi:hypothetical protein
MTDQTEALDFLRAQFARLQVRLDGVADRLDRIERRLDWSDVPFPAV